MCILYIYVGYVMPKVLSQVYIIYIYIYIIYINIYVSVFLVHGY